MTLGGVQLPLNDAPELFLEILTSDNVARSIVQVLGKTNVENLVVDVSLLPQVALSKDENEATSRNDDGDETVLFDMLIMIQSVIENHDANRYIVGAFNQESEKKEFIGRLRDTGYEEFENLKSVSVARVTNVTILTPTPGSSGDGSSRDGRKVALAVLIPIATLAIVGLLVLAIHNRRKTAQMREKEFLAADRAGDRTSSMNDDEEGSKINMVVNTTMDTSNMSILEDPTTMSHSDIIVDTGDVSTLGGDGVSRPASVTGGLSRMSEDKVSVDFDFHDYRIRADIPAIDGDSSMDKTPTELGLEESDDGSSAVGGMSLLSATPSSEYDYHHTSNIITSRMTKPLPTSYDEYYANQEMKGSMKSLTTLSASGSDGASSGLALLSLIDYDPEKMVECAPDEMQTDARKIALRKRSFDSESKETNDVVILDETFSIEERRSAGLDTLTEGSEDYTVADSYQTPVSTTTGISVLGKLNKMESVAEDVSVSDSMPHILEEQAPPKLTAKADMSSSKITSSSSSDVDFGYTNLSEHKGPIPKPAGRIPSRPQNTFASRITCWETASSIPTSDGSTYAATFEVSLPKGAFGLALEDSDQGAPKVKSIYQSSPLRGKVQTGDWLIKLDGMDVTSMKTNQVIRLINSKKNQKVRRLMFARTIEAMEGEDDTVCTA